MLTLLSLPEEVLLHIISYLPKSDVLRLLIVCKFFNDFISNSSKALENVFIDLDDNERDLRKLLIARKYSNIEHGCDKGIENLELMSIIGPQLRILDFSGFNFKLSNLIKILGCCSYLKKFTCVDENEMEVDDINEKILPSININKVNVLCGFKVLHALTKCKVKILSVTCWYSEKDKELFEPLRIFLQSQENLEVLEIIGLGLQLEPDIIPTHLKELKLTDVQKLQKFKVDFGIVKISQKIYFIPSLNQLSQLESLKHLHLKARGLGDFKELNVMENVQFLTVDFNTTEQSFIAGKFPNLKYLRVKFAFEFTFMTYLKFALMLLVGEKETTFTKIPFVLNEICFSEYKAFIKSQKVENSRESKITKTFFGANRFELELTVKTREQNIEMKIFMLKHYQRLNIRYNYKPTLESIDREILSEILSYLDIKDILNLRLVCKELNESMATLPKFMSESRFVSFFNE